MVKQYKIIVEKHSDGYVAYPLRLKGIVVGQGETYEEALSDVKSAIKFHIETFGEGVLEVDQPVLEAFVAEALPLSTPRGKRGTDSSDGGYRMSPERHCK